MYYTIRSDNSGITPEPGKRYDLGTLMNLLNEVRGALDLMGELDERLKNLSEHIVRGHIFDAREGDVKEAERCLGNARYSLGKTSSALAELVLIEKGARAYDAEVNGTSTEEA